MSDEVTPVVTPTAPVAPTVTVAPVVETPTAPTTVTVVKEAPVYTGSSPIETAVNVFTQSVGIDSTVFQNALVNALNYGDANLIDYAALTQGLDSEKAAQAKALAQSLFADTQARQATAVQQAQSTVYNLAGGEANWKVASDAFNTSAPDYLKVAVAQLLESNNVQHAAQLVLDTVRNSGMVNTQQGVPQVQGGTGAVQQGISQAEYFAEIHKLNKETGNRSYAQGSSAQRLNQLNAQRALGRQQGL